jgi:hypothetical protein
LRDLRLADAHADDEMELAAFAEFSFHP